MKFSRYDADVFVPGGSPPTRALARTTHLCIAAHQDDIEIMAQAGIDACYDNPARSFTGVIVTDGAGSPREGPYALFTDKEMQTVRREEQRRAASIGRYGLQLQLSHPSADVKAGGHPDVARDLLQIFSAAVPEVVYLHNLADKHDTHVAVVLRCLEACRALPPEKRPRQVFGCEVWRDLDWLVDLDKIALDAGAHPVVARQLLEAFNSQVQGGKRYDLATLGRRAAHATFHTAHETDKFSAITWAMDLTPLLKDETLSISEYTLGYIDRLRSEVADRLQRLVGK